MKREHPSALPTIAMQNAGGQLAASPSSSSSAARPCAFLVTCEHGGNRIPAAYRHYFSTEEKRLDSHRGYDAGALQLARRMAAAFDAPLLASTISRLLVDLNRSPHHRQLFSALLQPASAAERDAILRRYYLPYRGAVEQAVAQSIAQGRQVVHISCHSFTPVLDGVMRTADIGLLYDPQRQPEAALCRQWRLALSLQRPQLAIRRNYPYRGNADGLTTHLRRRHAAEDYCGIELEINQAQVTLGPAHWRRLQEVIIAALASAIGQMPAGGM